MKENKFQSKVKKQLENQGAFVINIHGHRMQISGLPDLQVIHLLWKGWLELKCEERETTAIQRMQAAKLKLRGVPVYVLRCVERKESDFWGVDSQYKYQLENFEGQIIKEFYNLRKLLDILVELDKEI